MRFSAIVLLLSTSAPAQSQTAGFYKEPLERISSEIGQNIDRAARMSADERLHAIDMRFAIYDASQVLDRVENYAERKNASLADGGSKPDRDLIYAASIAVQLQAAQEMLGNYLDVGDKVLLDSARTSFKLAEELTARR
ncbi:MAG: hypothetical protein AB7U35_09495 [Sphingobium sp.]